jgi:hypothetical protein
VLRHIAEPIFRETRLSVRALKLALLKSALRDGHDDASVLTRQIAALEAEIAEETRRREIEAKKPKRGRPRKKRPEQPPPEPPECEPFAIAPVGWSASDAVPGLRGLARFSSDMCDKNSGFGFEELGQWLSAAAMAFEAGDADAGSFYALGAIGQMGNATANLYKDWAELGLNAVVSRKKHGNRYDEDGNLKERRPKGPKRRANFRE